MSTAASLLSVGGGGGRAGAVSESSAVSDRSPGEPGLVSSSWYEDLAPRC